MVEVDPTYDPYFVSFQARRREILASIRFGNNRIVEPGIQGGVAYRLAMPFQIERASSANNSATSASLSVTAAWPST